MTTLLQSEIDSYLRLANEFRGRGDDLLANMCMQTIERIMPTMSYGIRKRADYYRDHRMHEVYATELLPDNKQPAIVRVLDGVKYELFHQFYDGSARVYQYRSIT